jgi:hypothetical protein
LWALALGAGVLAGIASSIGGEASTAVFKPRLIAAKSKGRSIRVATRHDQAISDAKNAGLAFVIVGGFLGAGLGAAGGLARGSVRAAATTGFLGLILGSVTALVASAAALPLYDAYSERHLDDVSQNLIPPILVHAGIYSALGAAGGLALAIGLRERNRVLPCFLAAMAGAALAAITFDLVGSAVFPLAKTTQIVPEAWASRLLSRLAVSVSGAVGAACAATMAKQHSYN